MQKQPKKKYDYYNISKMVFQKTLNYFFFKLKQSKLKNVKPTVKSKGKLKVEKDVIKGDFDDFLKKEYRAGYDEDEDDDFM